MWVKCGAPVQQASALALADPNAKDWLTAVLLCWFLGIFGIHRFYTGYTAVGIVQLVTLGGCGIWTLVDLIMILTRSYKDSEGRLLARK